MKKIANEWDSVDEVVLDHYIYKDYGQIVVRKGEYQQARISHAGGVYID